MEPLEGILNLSVFIIPLGRKLLNRTRNTKDQEIKLGQPITVNSGKIYDFKRWIHLLKISNKEIFISNIVER